MQMVRDIMSTTVRTISRDAIICDLEEIFVSHEISGAPLVDDSGNLAGFVSKSDVTRFDSSGEDPNYARVYEIASPTVITISPTASIEAAARKMLDEHVHHLVVIESDTLVGILSSFDFVRVVANNYRVSESRAR